MEGPAVLMLIVALIFTVILSLFYIPLALREKKLHSDLSRYVISALLFTISLGFLFAALEFRVENRNREHLLHSVIGQVLPTIEVEMTIRLATKGFGMWLVIVAAGELLRLILSRPVGSELLGPLLLFLAGALLIEPHWVVGITFGIGIVAVAVVAVWGRNREVVVPATAARDAASGAST